MKKLLLILLILLFMPAVRCPCMPAQHTEEVDSLIRYIYDKNAPADTHMVKVLYRLVQLITDFGYQTRLKTKKSIDVRDLCERGLEISTRLGYREGIDAYFLTMDYGCGQRIFAPYIEFQTYPVNDATGHLNALHHYHVPRHNGSLYTWLYVPETLRKYRLENKIYAINYRIGLCYFDWANYRTAHDYLRTALQQVRQSADSIALTDILFDLGMTFYRLGTYDSARAMFMEALAITSLKRSDAGIAVACNNAGETFLAEGRYGEALPYFIRSGQHAGIMHDTIMLAKAYLKTGYTYAMAGQYNGAFREISLASGLAGTAHEKTVERDVYYVLSEMYNRMGDSRQAFRCRSRYYAIKDSLFDLDVADYIATLEGQWQTLVSREITRKEREAIDARQTMLQLDKTRFWAILVSAGICLSLLFLYLIYRSYVTKKRANSYLMSLNQERNKLISVISHDLRGPLAGFLNILAHMQRNIHTLSHENIRENLDRIHVQAGIIKKLLDNLLEWAKLQRGDIRPSMEKLPVKELMERNVALYQSMAAGKAIDLQNHVESNTRIYADAYMMDTIIRNLLDNAIKYTGPNGHITVSERHKGDMIEISVTDDGKGIEKEQLDALFATSGNTNRNAYRSGLGLLLCREYMESCGGKIHAESQGEGRGSAFILTLPVAVPDTNG